MASGQSLVVGGSRVQFDSEIEKRATRAPQLTTAHEHCNIKLGFFLCLSFKYEIILSYHSSAI